MISGWCVCLVLVLCEENYFLIEEFIVKVWVFVKCEYVIFNIGFCVMVKLVVGVKVLDDKKFKC